MVLVEDQEDHTSKMFDINLCPLFSTDLHFYFSCNHLRGDYMLLQILTRSYNTYRWLYGGERNAAYGRIGSRPMEMGGGFLVELFPISHWDWCLTWKTSSSLRSLFVLGRAGNGKLQDGKKRTSLVKRQFVKTDCTDLLPMIRPKDWCKSCWCILNDQ